MIKKLLLFVVLFWFSTPVFSYEFVETAWVRRYDGTGHGLDRARDIAVDDSGYVYVTGWSYAGTTWWDYATIKYDSDGDIVWVETYNGPGNDIDHGRAIAVDDSGYVYVTGFSPGVGTAGDYATIKYYPSGDTAWVRRYNGPADDPDGATAIAVDDSGYVYVTGGSNGIETGNDYATMKYYPNGDTVWIRRYNGPADGGDYAEAIAVDDSGYVYVTGSSSGVGTGDDYATLKYYPNGDTVWVRRYNGPGNGNDNPDAIAVDDSGYVYVTGRGHATETDDDYTTLKYYPNGDTAWVRRYNNPAVDGQELANAIAVDDSGYVYVTGSSMGTGTWQCPDYATVKYRADGEVAWVERYSEPQEGEDYAKAIVVDDSGYVYVTGASSGDGTSADYATIKYAPSGDTVWVTRYNGPIDSYDGAEAIAIDDSGSVYVTGRSTLIDEDYLTIKYVMCDSCCLPGDVNNTGIVAIKDITDLLNYLYMCGEVLCFEQSDANGNCEIDLGDIDYLVRYLFKAGPAPLPHCSNPDNFLDPGVKDTVRLEATEAKPGRPFVIPMSIFNDNLILINIPLKIEDTTRIVLDSIVFEGTRGEGLFVGISNYSCEGSSGILIHNQYPNYPLYAGTGISGYLWGHVKEGADTGFVKLDTSFLEPTHQLRFFKSDTYSLIPEFVYGGVRVLFPYTCGDVDGNDLVELPDIVYFINYLFTGGDPPQCPPEPYTSCADTNGDGEVGLADAVYLINYVLKSGPDPIC